MWGAGWSCPQAAARAPALLGCGTNPQPAHSPQPGPGPCTRPARSVLMAYYVAQWAAVALVLRWRYARLSPARHVGAPTAAGDSPRTVESGGGRASTPDK